MPCVSCQKGISEIQIKKQDEDWLSREEVRGICEECYNNMVLNNISRIKKSVLVGKIKENMTVKLYEIVYNGPENSKFNFGGHPLEPNSPKYFLPEELPFSVAEMKKISFIKFSIVELDSKPVTQQEILKAKGNYGVMWVGSAPKWMNDYGTFIKNEPRYDLPKEAIDVLKNTAGFKII